MIAGHITTDGRLAMLFVGADVVRSIRPVILVRRPLCAHPLRQWPKAPPIGSCCAFVCERELGPPLALSEPPGAPTLGMLAGGSSFRSVLSSAPGPWWAGARLSGRHTTICLVARGRPRCLPRIRRPVCRRGVGARSVGGHVGRGDRLEDAFSRRGYASKPQPSPRRRCSLLARG